MAALHAVSVSLFIALAKFSSLTLSLIQVRDDSGHLRILEDRNLSKLLTKHDVKEPWRTLGNNSMADSLSAISTDCPLPCDIAADHLSRPDE